MLIFRGVGMLGMNRFAANVWVIDLGNHQPIHRFTEGPNRVARGTKKEGGPMDLSDHLPTAHFFPFQRSLVVKLWLF